MSRKPVGKPWGLLGCFINNLGLHTLRTECSAEGARETLRPHSAQGGGFRAGGSVVLET